MGGLDTALIVAIATSLLAWVLLSAKLSALDVSAPMFFVAIGLVSTSGPVSPIDVNVHGETLKVLAELTLALLLFSDAARVNGRELRHDAAIPLRLLVGGLPLTIGLGTVFAVLLFPDLDAWAAAAIAAAVAPTDAALGAQVVEDRNVPHRIRRVLNVESGLNDGIATPFVTFFIAGAVADTMSHSSTGPGAALADLAIGVLVGTGVGVAGGLLMTLSVRHGWAAPAYRGIGALALALTAYALSIEAGGNGFIGAFIGGLAFGTAVHGRDRDEALEFDAQSGDLLSLIVWFLFGAAMVPALDAVTWRTVVFAVLALTVARMLPVALVLTRSGLTRATVAFIGWFGPRGLASIVFGLLAFDALEGPDAEAVLATVTLTVLLSVVAHGLTARPLSRRYGQYVASLAATTPERAVVPSLPVRAPVAGAGVARRTVAELGDADA